MKNILCFGDSNTWGYDPDTGTQYAKDIRWTGRLQKALPDYNIIECGLCGRTTVFEDDVEAGRSGIEALPFTLMTHDPIDLIIFMLGTNDCKCRFGLTPMKIAHGMQQLIHLASTPTLWNGSQIPQILVVAPAPMRPSAMQGMLQARTFDTDSILCAAELATVYEQVCIQDQVAFWDAAQVVPNVTSSDGVHLSPFDHVAFAKGIQQQIITCLEG